MENLADNIKKAFEYKNQGLYKEAIDFFYKAFTVDNDSIEIMSELAHLYSKLNQIDRAIDFCEQILSKNPNDFQIRFYIAKLYKKSKNYKKAEENLFYLFEKNHNIICTTQELFAVLQKTENAQKIIDLYLLKSNDLESSFIYCYVGWAYLVLKNKTLSEEYFKKSFVLDESNVESGSRVAEQLFDDGSYEDAEFLLNKLLEYSENDRIYYLLAEINYIKSNYDKAITYYSLALKLNDKNGLYYYKLGGLYVFKGFYREAEECYTKAVNIESENLFYCYTLGFFYFINKKYSLAKQVINDLLKRDKNYLDAIILKLRILLRENDLTNARRIVEKLSDIKTDNEQLYYALALYYAQLNRWKKAVEYINEAISLNSNSCDYNYELASYYFELKEYDKSKDICEKIIALNDKFIQAYVLISKIYLNEKDLEKALDNINSAMKLDINIPEIYYMKGIIASKKNQEQKAIENYKTAISMSPSTVEYYGALASYYYSVGDYESAYEYFKESCVLDVSNGEYRYYMAKCSEELGDIQAAIYNYSMAKRLSPLNITYVEEYAKILINHNKKKQAVSLVKSAMKYFSKEEKNKLKKLIN